MTPLNITTIKSDYAKTLKLDNAVAEELAYITKGYAFAYQALGKYMWDSNKKILTDEVLNQLDEALAEKVYKKIWEELAPRDKWYLEFICQKDQMSASELLELTKKNHSDWSEPRKRLSEKGIINVKIRGQIIVNLPRFNSFIDKYTI